MRYILAIDQGTTSSRCVIFNEGFHVVAMAQQTFPQHYPESSWVEHDLGELWASVESSVSGALKEAARDPAFRPENIAAIGITNQRETFGVWERATGTPIGRAIVWQCRRSAALCERLRKTPAGRKLATTTGLVIDPYFSGTKLKWLLDAKPELRKRAAKGELCFGTMDTYLMWRLTGGDCFATDVTNASRTMFMDLKTLRWSPTCLKTLGVPASMLPQIRDSDAEFGRTRGLNFLPDGIPITGVLGDQQAALFGQECWEAGMAKCTYGTGAFVLLNTGAKVRRTKSGVSTVAWKIKGKPTYCLEGSLFIAGAAVQWLRDGLGLLESSAHIEKLAAQVESSDGVFFIPALTGLGSPYWAPQAKGLIGGLTRRSTKSHVARACLEGIGYSVADLFEALVKDALVKLRFLRVDGGASRNEMLLKFQSDLMGVTIQRPSDIESTARGAGFVAALGAGMVRSTKELAGKNPVIFEVKPTLKAKESKALLAVWRRRVKALLAGCY
jgi:glycerol kinase